MDITYKEIANYTNKVESTMKQMKKNNPEQLELLKIGAICKKYNINMQDLNAINEMKKNIISNNTPNE